MLKDGTVPANDKTGGEVSPPAGENKAATDTTAVVDPRAVKAAERAKLIEDKKKALEDKKKNIRR